MPVLGTRVLQRALPSATFVAAALVLAGCGASSTPATSNPASSWTTPVQVEPTSSASLYGVSCVSSAWCVAVDDNGSAILRQDGRWKPPVPVPAGGTLTSVACSSTTHCIAVSSGGRASTFNGKRWSPGQAIGPPASYDISCPTANFCAAVGASGTPSGGSTVATFSRSRWSSMHVLVGGSPLNHLLGVSCATATFCVAINYGGSALVYDGTRWASATTGVPQGLWAISCPTRTFCMAISTAAYSTFDGTKWSEPSPIPGLEPALARSVSCLSSTVCTVIGLSGSGADWRHGAWSKPSIIFPGGVVASVALSCVAPNTCVAVNSRGLASSS